MTVKIVLPEGIEGVVNRFEVGLEHQPGIPGNLKRLFGIDVDDVHSAKVLTLFTQDTRLSTDELEILRTGKPLVDRVVESATLNEPFALVHDIPFDWVLEYGFRPGTSDPWGEVAKEQIELRLGRKLTPREKVFFSQQMLFRAPKLKRPDMARIADFLASPNLYMPSFARKRRFEKRFLRKLPIMGFHNEPKVEKYDLAAMTDEQLMALNKERSLAATLDELHVFRDLYKNPAFLAKRRNVGLDHMATDVELDGYFGVRSEHCFHKEFNAEITLDDLSDDPVFKRFAEKGIIQEISPGKYKVDSIFKTFIKKPAFAVRDRLEKRGCNWIVSMFEDNSGVVLFNKDYMYGIKVETHNSPSAIEPVQGSKTGLDGVNRDIFGTMKGSFEAIANIFFFCTGFPFYQGWLPPRTLHPYHIFTGLVEGTKEAGNESQIGVINGGSLHDPRFGAKGLDYCGTIEFSPVEVNGISMIGKNLKPGYIGYVIGQPVGLGGIHGGTISSLSRTEAVGIGHVQNDFSYMQIKMYKLILEAARKGLIEATTDHGALGVASAFLETAADAGGMVIDLEKHPRKFEEILPWQVFISEEQNRMLGAIKLEKKAEFEELAKLFEVPVTAIAEYNDSGMAEIRWGDKVVGLMDLKETFDKTKTRKKMDAEWKAPALNDVDFEQPIGRAATIEEMLAMPDIASKEWIFRQKDSGVRGMTVVSPVRNGIDMDATMQAMVETGTKGALVYSQGIAPKVSDFDPYISAQVAFLEMAGKIVAMGGRLPDMSKPGYDSWAVCDNFCQPNSLYDANNRKGKQNLAALVREGMGLYDCIESLDVPVISGKDSMKCTCRLEVEKSLTKDQIPVEMRDFVDILEEGGKKFIEIHDPPTLLMSAAAKIENYDKAVTMDFKSSGDLIYAIGTTKDDMAGSQYYEMMGKKLTGKPFIAGKVNPIDLGKVKKVFNKVSDAIDEGVLASSAYIHKGGIGVCAAKCAMAGDLGATIRTELVPQEGVSRDDITLYSETPGRFIVSVSPENKEKFENLMEGVSYACIGEVHKKGFDAVRVMGRETFVDTVSLRFMRKSYKTPFKFDMIDERLN